MYLATVVALAALSSPGAVNGDLVANPDTDMSVQGLYPSRAGRVPSVCPNLHHRQ